MDEQLVQTSYCSSLAFTSGAAHSDKINTITRTGQHDSRQHPGVSMKVRNSLSVANLKSSNLVGKYPAYSLYT